MNYEDKILNCETLEELFDTWKYKEPQGKFNHLKDYFIADGIVNIKTWNDLDRKKILFVLKEAYGKDWGDHTLATWLRDCHPTHRMWKRVARLTYGIQNTVASSIKRYKPELSEAEHIEALNQIAVINLKKSHGNSQSNYDDIKEYAEYDKVEIKKEMELIDPDIIICGATFKTLYSSVYGHSITDLDFSDNWYYYLNIDGKERLFIDYYHPAIQWSDLLVYYGLLGIYQQALIEKENR